MTTFSKTLLTVAATGLAGGSIIDFHGVAASPILAAVLPLGAVGFGLFLIVFMLEKEAAKYDDEQAKKLPLCQRNAATPVVTQKPDAHPAIVLLKEKTL